jgi:hypothetical protein
VKADFGEWSDVMQSAAVEAVKGEPERANSLIRVAAEIRCMMLGLRQAAAMEANAGGMRMVVQATTQNEHTVNRPVKGEPNG